MTRVKASYQYENLDGHGKKPNRKVRFCFLIITLIGLAGLATNATMCAQLNQLVSPITAYPINDNIIRNPNCVYWDYDGSLWPPTGLISIKGSCGCIKGVPCRCLIEECFGANRYNNLFLVSVVMQIWIGLVLVCIFFHLLCSA